MVMFAEPGTAAGILRLEIQFEPGKWATVLELSAWQLIYLHELHGGLRIGAFGMRRLTIDGALVPEPVPVDDPEAFDNGEFNTLVNEGALSHPLVPFRLTRAYLALRWLVDRVPGAAAALRRWAQDRDAQDAAAAGGPEQ